MHGDVSINACWSTMMWSMHVTVTVTVTDCLLNKSYRKVHTLPPSCPGSYADLFRAPLHERDVFIEAWWCIDQCIISAGQSVIIVFITLQNQSAPSQMTMLANYDVINARDVLIETGSNCHRLRLRLRLRIILLRQFRTTKGIVRKTYHTLLKNCPFNYFAQ